MYPFLVFFASWLVWHDWDQQETSQTERKILPIDCKLLTSWNILDRLPPLPSLNEVSWGLESASLVSPGVKHEAAAQSHAVTLQEGCSLVMGEGHQVRFLSWGPSSLLLEISHLARHAPAPHASTVSHPVLLTLLIATYISSVFFQFPYSGIFSPIDVSLVPVSFFKELGQLQQPGIKRSKTLWIGNRESHLAITGSAIN